MGKIGAPYGNKNAAGGHKKSGGGGVNYNSPKFLKAARRQAKVLGAGGAGSRQFLKNRAGSASRYSKF